MEFNEYSTRQVLEPIDVVYYSDRSRTPTPPPVFSSNVCCDLEDILSDVSALIVFDFIKIILQFRP